MKLLRKVDVKNLRLNSDKITEKVQVKLFNPYGAGTWWLHTFFSENNDNMVWGWAMINCDRPEYGLIDLRELESLRMFGKPQIERDRYFEPCGAEEVYQQ
tara:strand:- start:1085 stop:1384 length:300 start_codon:yes stop_codon:yes gene_type:complete